MLHRFLHSLILLLQTVPEYCKGVTCSNMRQQLIPCQCDGRMLKKCYVGANCLLEIDDYSLTSIAINFEITTSRCYSKISVTLNNVKVKRLDGLTNALKRPNVQTLGIGSVSIKESSQLEMQSVEEMSDLKIDGFFSLWKNFADTTEKLNITRLMQNAKNFELNENYADVISEGLIDLSLVRAQLIVMNTIFEGTSVNVFHNGHQSKRNKTVVWKNNDVNPRFLETDQSFHSLSIRINGGHSFLRKTSLMNVKSTSIDSINLDYYNRIEYGTISNGKEFRFIKLESNDQELFKSGLCTQITDSNTCELCLMHQYALRRNEDSVEQKCRDKIQITNQLQKCYWSQPEPIPCSLRSFDIFDSWIDKNVPVCTNIPEDIQRYLESILSGKKLDIFSSTLLSGTTLVVTIRCN